MLNNPPKLLAKSLPILRHLGPDPTAQHMEALLEDLGSLGKRCYERAKQGTGLRPFAQQAQGVIGSAPLPHTHEQTVASAEVQAWVEQCAGWQASYSGPAPWSHSVIRKMLSKCLASVPRYRALRFQL